jgi:hypothetical protein
MAALVGLAACDAAPGGDAGTSSAPAADAGHGGASTSPPHGGAGGAPFTSDPGAPVHAALRGAAAEALAAIQGELAACDGLTAEELEADHALPFSTLGYDPLTAKNLPLIQGAAFAHGPAEQAALQKNGFVVSHAKRYPSFFYAYANIYVGDLPVYVSADSVLYAVHKSFDAILQRIEDDRLAPELVALLGSMRAGLAGGAASELSAIARADADLLLAVALALATGKPAAPVAGADAATIDALVTKAKAATAVEAIPLFGEQRPFDFTQMKPRGHYANDPLLEPYFRAMMWLGRADLHLLAAGPGGALVLRRRQLEAALALRAITDADALARWQRLAGVAGAFVGEPDAMTLAEIRPLLDALGAKGPADVAAMSDDAVAQAIVDGGFGAQRIASELMAAGGQGTIPLSRSFAVFPQRYTFDAHVLSNVSFDRVGGGSIPRMMPSPLDVAFATLHADVAASLLAPDLATYPYAPDLCRMRVLGDAHPKEAFEGSLSGLWLDALRALAPGAEVASPAASGLPAVAGTEPWARRLLSTELASWAELRHDTLLYAKQSYGSPAPCEFPDAYVDPYPAFYDRIVALAERGKALPALLGLGADDELGSKLSAYFAELSAVASTLSAMATSLRAGVPLTPDQYAFVNQAVKTSPNCTGDIIGDPGWYGRLFFHHDLAPEFDPTIADVFTEPTDAHGDDVGRILHVGTGEVRAMVVTVDTCDGPRAYVGPVSSYFERITEGWKRLDDVAWAAEELKGAADPPWVSDFVVH